MGRNTFEGLIAHKQTLPDRKKIVLSSKQHMDTPKGFYLSHNLDDALSYAKEQKNTLFVIGGARLYTSMLNYASKIYITFIDVECEGDTYLDWYELADGKWKETERETHKKDDINPYDYAFTTWERV